nr:pleiotropic drug resistance protein 1-like [Ipomoea batatas]
MFGKRVKLMRNDLVINEISEDDANDFNDQIRVDIDLPTIEVRFEHLNVDAEAYGFLNSIHILPNRKKPLPILHEVIGIIKPRRMTLLLGPSSSGKTILLLALADWTRAMKFVPAMAGYTCCETCAYKLQGISFASELISKSSKQTEHFNESSNFTIGIALIASFCAGGVPYLFRSLSANYFNCKGIPPLSKLPHTPTGKHQGRRLVYTSKLVNTKQSHARDKLRFAIGISNVHGETPLKL